MSGCNESRSSSEISGFSRIDLESKSERSDSIIIGNNEITNNESDGRTGFDIQAALDECIRDIVESTEISEIEEEPCSNIFVRGMETNFKRSRLIHDIFRIPTRSEAEKFVSFIRETGFHGGLFIVAWHVDHVHVIHDCDFSNQQCRCVRITNFYQFKKKNRRNVRRGGVTYTYLWNLARYFLLGQRTYLYIEIGGYDWLQCYTINDLSVWFDCCERDERLVEKYQNEVNICNTELHGSNSNDGEQIATTSRGKNSERKSNERCKEEKLLQFIRKFPTTPLRLITTRPEYLESEYKFLDINSNIFTNIERVFSIEIMNLTTTNLYDYYMNCYPTFNAFNGNLENFYYTTEQSLYYMEEFLLHQFNNDSNEIYLFLLNLLNICDKRIPKKNCLQIFGPPCSGKNWFFDAVVSYYMFVGYIGNFNKYCSFPLMECVNKRILLWNEPNCEPAAFDTIKMLFGGDNLTVKVKYQGDGLVVRTPVIVLGNYNPFPNTNEFACRTYTYNFIYAEMLKDLKCKPHPLSYYLLLKKYNLQYICVLLSIILMHTKWLN